MSEHTIFWNLKRKIKDKLKKSGKTILSIVEKPESEI